MKNKEETFICMEGDIIALIKTTNKEKAAKIFAKLKKEQKKNG
jgi:hypothetical protein